MTTTLAETCEDFQTEVEDLDAGADDYAVHLTAAIKRLARDAAEHVAEYTLGEVPALLQRCHAALAAIAAEAEDPEDRHCRYYRQTTVLRLLMLADGIARYHALSRAQQRKAVDDLRDQVGYALAGLVERDEA